MKRSPTPWLLLLSRTALFALFQIVIAGLLSLSGAPMPWKGSAAWWPISATLANLVSILLLVRVVGREQGRFFDFIPGAHHSHLHDLGLAVPVAAAVLLLAILPGQWLADILFGSAETVFALMFQPLPRWAGIVSLLFPLTIAFAELPTYFGYVMPRLEKQLGNGWLAWGLASLFLAGQHITLPLIFDWRFMAWRFGMFVPLAFLMGLSLKLRPRLFPHLMTVHALLDLSTVAIILAS